MNNVRKLRKAAKLSQKALGKLSGVSESFICNIEKDQKTPSVDVMYRMAEALGCSIADLGLREEASIVTEVVQSELEYKYSFLDDHGRAVVDFILDMEYRRCVEAKVIIEKPKKIIQLFPAAAGPGEPVDGAAYEDYEVPEDSNADFAVRISGDSMEPEFEAGSIVLCENKPPKVGDIVVVLVNGCRLVKQFIPGIEGQFYLRSLNRARSDLDYDYIPSGNDTVEHSGVVIHKRVPLVEQ